MPGRQLILYSTTAKKEIGCVLGQHDESGRKERAIYYLNNKFMDCECHINNGREALLCTCIGCKTTSIV